MLQMSAVPHIPAFGANIPDQRTIVTYGLVPVFDNPASPRSGFERVMSAGPRGSAWQAAGDECYGLYWASNWLWRSTARPDRQTAPLGATDRLPFQTPESLRHSQPHTSSSP
jgi:hypothetical protein